MYTNSCFEILDIYCIICTAISQTKSGDNRIVLDLADFRVKASRQVLFFGVLDLISTNEPLILFP